MYRVFTKIVIQQLTQIHGAKARNKTLTFNFVNSMTWQDNWRDLTNEGTIILPKNIYVRDENDKLIPLAGTNVNVGGFSNEGPLFMRGDRVIADWGYRYFKNGREVFETTEDTKNDTHLYKGYISEVTSKKPIELKVQEGIWKLKQIAAPIKTFKETDTLEYILSYLLKGTEFTVNTITNTTFGAFRTGNETIAEVLSRLRKEYHFESYFKNNQLRCGPSIYVESEAKTFTFTFQKDIISDDLEYKRKDDLVLSIVATNKIEESTGKTTKDGHAKTKTKRLEALVTLRNGSDTPTVFIKKKNEDYPSNTGGERLTLPYPGAKTIDELVSLATKELKKYYYTGFKGKFTTFGIPFVQVGDNVKFVDPILPERNGLYKVRGVEYEGGVNGLRQKIELDYKILV